MLNRSEGFPLTGLFHPWAQWDLGQTWVRNYSRRAAAAAARPPWREGFAKKQMGKFILHTWPINQGSRPLSRDPFRQLIIDAYHAAL